MSEDPARDGENWYAYCNENPLRFVDPTGLAPRSTMGFGNNGLLRNPFEGRSSRMADMARSLIQSAMMELLCIPPNGVTPAKQAVAQGAFQSAVAPIASFANEIAQNGFSFAKKLKPDNADKTVTSGDDDTIAHTSRAARRQAMRDAEIPTSQQPASQTQNSSGREYSYDVPVQGGGTELKSVQQQTMDRSHPGESHWEAGSVKRDPLTGEIRQNNYGRPALTNNKVKVDY